MGLSRSSIGSVINHHRLFKYLYLRFVFPEFDITEKEQMEHTLRIEIKIGV